MGDTKHIAYLVAHFQSLLGAATSDLRRPSVRPQARRAGSVETKLLNQRERSEEGVCHWDDIDSCRSDNCGYTRLDICNKGLRYGSDRGCNVEPCGPIPASYDSHSLCLLFWQAAHTDVLTTQARIQEARMQTDR